MKYTAIIQDMTWSYTRLTSFESCPYKFLLTYIKRSPKVPMFFSDYGTFVHKIIELCLTGQLPKEQLVPYYLENFRQEIKGQAPNTRTFDTYFHNGLEYLKSFSYPYPLENVIGVERHIDFDLDGHRFTGIIDSVVSEGDDFIIVDNKSRNLKHRSKRKKPTKSDEELDKYLRQLYLYSIPLVEEYGKFPKRLEFNCFREGQLISEPFVESAYEEAKQWALGIIHTIEENENWKPVQEFWKCHYLCERNCSCCYYQNGRS